MIGHVDDGAVRRVRDTLQRLGARGQVRRLDDDASTPVQVAASLGVTVGQVARSVVFWADRHLVLVLASGGHDVDEEQLGAILDVTHVTTASPEQVRHASGFAVGGVAPVAHHHPMRTIIDIALSRYDEIWVAGGDPRHVFPTSYDELLRITAGEAAEIGA